MAVSSRLSAPFLITIASTFYNLQNRTQLWLLRYYSYYYLKRISFSLKERTTDFQFINFLFVAFHSIFDFLLLRLVASSERPSDYMGSLSSKIKKRDEVLKAALYRAKLCNVTFDVSSYLINFAKHPHTKHTHTHTN